MTDGTGDGRNGTPGAAAGWGAETGPLEGEQAVRGAVVTGHGVASGRADDPRFPDGTIRMQVPHFTARGLDLSAFEPATINVSIAPRRWRLVRPDHTFRDVRWHPVEPAEDFSFVAIALVGPDGGRRPAMVYHPHPDTKPDHVQPDDVVEVLAPRLPGIAPGVAVTLFVPSDRIRVD